MSKVLLTGSAGGVGQALLQGLLDRGHEVRGFDLIPTPGAPDAVVGDCGDATLVEQALTGMDAVIHLAAISDEASYDDIIESNIRTAFVMFDAVRRLGVPRIVYASSHHAVGFARRDAPIDCPGPYLPDTYYGVSKVLGEALGQLTHDRWGTHVINVRIGTVGERPRTRRQLATWISPHDVVDLFDAALRHPDPGYVTVFGMSPNTRNRADLTSAYELGYRPQDDAEAWAPQVERETEPLAPDDPEELYLGGKFTAIPIGVRLKGVPGA